MFFHSILSTQNFPYLTIPRPLGDVSFFKICLLFSYLKEMVSRTLAVKIVQQNTRSSTHLYFFFCKTPLTYILLFRQLFIPQDPTGNFEYLKNMYVSAFGIIFLIQKRHYSKESDFFIFYSHNCIYVAFVFWEVIHIHQ